MQKSSDNDDCKNDDCNVDDDNDDDDGDDDDVNWGQSSIEFSRLMTESEFVHGFEAESSSQLITEGGARAHSSAGLSR